MSWKQLLAVRKVHTHQTSKQELDELRAVVKRDLADAALPALSEDRRFATAYNAALQAARMATACAGYRVAAVPGHYALSYELFAACMRFPLFDNRRDTQSPKQ